MNHTAPSSPCIHSTLTCDTLKSVGIRLSCSVRVEKAADLIAVAVSVATMAQWKLLLIFGLLLSASVYRIAADEDAAEAKEEADEAEDDEDYQEADKAHLIVRKYFKDEFGVQGRNLTVFLEIYNAGQA